MSGPGEVDEWITDICATLGHIKNEGVKTGSICRVPEQIREANKEKSEEWYRPKYVAMGPIHRGATIDLQTMELTKWECAHKLFSRVTPKDDLSPESQERISSGLRRRIHNLIGESCKEIKGLESIIRGSYGDTIHMGTEEFARIMFLDACFLLEVLLSLSDEDDTFDSDPGHMDDGEWISPLLTDLMLLENQVPFLLLDILFHYLFLGLGEQEHTTNYRFKFGANLVAFASDTDLWPKKLARSLFGRNVAIADFPNDVCHFLHLIHLCSPDPYQNQDILSKDPLQLHRCARKLQAFGIIIRARRTDYEGNVNEPGTVASAVIREFMDKFEFKIEFNETLRELIIPTLHIKEETEIRWRNFIAWEQIGWFIGAGYKFTSYAYFFEGLVCSVHDVQLLREAGVIKVHTEANDEDLLKMFQSIATGAETTDKRYTDVCEDLNKANVKGVAGWRVLILRMPWHYWRRFLEWLQHGFISMLLSFIDTYLGTPWKFIGVVSGLALLVLTIMQTIYAARSSH